MSSDTQDRKCGQCGQLESDTGVWLVEGKQERRCFVKSELRRVADVAQVPTEEECRKALHEHCGWPEADAAKGAPILRDFFVKWVQPRKRYGLRAPREGAPEVDTSAASPVPPTDEIIERYAANITNPETQYERRHGIIHGAKWMRDAMMSNWPEAKESV